MDDIKSVTGLSVNDFKRLVKYKKVALISGQHNQEDSIKLQQKNIKEKEPIKKGPKIFRNQKRNDPDIPIANQIAIHLYNLDTTE